MKRILDLGFGRRTLYEMFKSSAMSSRLQYGLAQLENLYAIDHVSLEPQSFRGTIKNNLTVLRNYDVVFMTYLYLPPLILIALLRKIGLFKKRKLIAICHVSLEAGRSQFEKLRNRWIYSEFDMILFHSPKNRKESLDSGLISTDHSDVLCWGDDLDFVDKNIEIKEGRFFLSTGREQRDFPMLLNVFTETGGSLEIYTNKVNYENNYEFLLKEENHRPNIKIEYVEKDAGTAFRLAQRTAECLCVVIPLLQGEIYYCLGLTSLVESMAMGKPVICSRNPYSPIDIEKERIGIWVDDEKSWKEAVLHIQNHPKEALEMGKRARKLAEDHFNINNCSKQLRKLFG